jgi:predicted ATPase
MSAHLILDRFKAFASRQQVPLNRLTLLFGANSSGKSSIIHGLLTMKQAAASGWRSFDVRRPLTSGRRLDLGGFRNIVNSRSKRGFTLGLGLHSTAERNLNQTDDAFPASEVFGDYLDGYPSDIGVEVSSKAGNIDSIEVMLDQRPFAQLVFIASKIDGFVIRDVDVKHPLYPLVAKDRDTGRRASKKELLGRLRWTGIRPDSRSYFVHPDHRPDEAAGPASPEWRLLRIVERAIFASTNFVERALHLGPIRDIPDRFHGAEDVYGKPTMSEGSAAWETLLNDKKARSELDVWLRDRKLLGRRFELDVDHSVTLSEVIRSTKQRGNWPNHEAKVRQDMFMRAQNPARPFLLVNDVDAGRRASSLHDVGFGLSQVLPVLAYSLVPDSLLIAIEQPELHVHPAAQADLADLFIEASTKTVRRKGNNFLLETHSEHLILRLLRRIRETKAGNAPENRRITASEVSILFVSPSDEGSWVTHLPVDDNGEFTEPWPEGFLPDRTKEL